MTPTLTPAEYPNGGADSMSTRPADKRGASRRGATDKKNAMYRIEVYYDDDSGWCAEITDDNGDFVGITIGRTEDDAKRKAQSMIKEAS